MATKRRISNALPIAEVKTITIAGVWATNDTTTFTINGKDLILTAGAAVATTDIAAALKALLAGDAAVGTETRSETGDSVPECTEFEATVSSSVVTLTGATKGVPLPTITVTENTAGSGTATLASVTSAAGPWHWGGVDNWDTGTIPVTGVNEQQTITIDADGGTFTVTYSGSTTAAQAFNVSAANLQTALQGLASVGAGNITVTGGPGAAGGGTPYTLTFVNALGFQNVAAVTTNAGSLTGGAGTAAVATTVAGSTGDDVYIENLEEGIYYDLAQSAIALNSLNLAASFTGDIGLPDINEEGLYWEGRAKLLAISATTLKIGYGPGAGSKRLKINLGSNLFTATVEKTASSAEQGLPALLLLGTNTYNVLNASEGSIGVAVEAGQTSTLLTVRCGHENSQDSDVTLRLGSGVTLTTVNQTGGDLEINSNLTTLARTGGTCTLKGTATVATLNNEGGILYDESTGTKTTVNNGAGATIDRSRTMLGCTYTATNFYKGSKFRDPFETVTFTAAFALVRCGLKDVELDLGTNFSLQRS